MDVKFLQVIYNKGELKMIFKFYYEEGIYFLDREKGRDKIYNIINKSTPKKVRKIFKKQSFADVPSGTYYFYIKNYSLELTYFYPNICLFFSFLDKIIKSRENIILTLEYEDSCSYIVAMPIANKEVRLVFLDNKNSKLKRKYNRKKDYKLENTIAVCDVIINRYELIRQFNSEFKRIYQENEYYLSEEYEQKCAAEDAIVYQEYVLNDFKDYSEKFANYLDNFQKNIEENSFK